MRSEFIDYNPDYITDNILQADVLWLFSNWIWREIPIDLLNDKKVIATIHHIDPQKLNVEDFLLRDRFCDAYHVFSEKTIPHFPDQIDKNKIHVVPYWYNNKLWTDNENKPSLREKFSIPHDKLVIGSFQRDTEGFDLKTPKLSKGPDIFCDIIENIEPKPHILLSGFRRQYIISRLESAGISYSYFEMADFNTLNELYNCLDLYLVTSRQEGGPQAILECSSNKTPILSTDVGFASKALNSNCILESAQDFIDKIQSKDFDYTLKNNEKLQSYTMEKIMPKYIDLFESL
jgi:glycosyltransferase involved in cell wall biosynthesis